MYDTADEFLILLETVGPTTVLSWSDSVKPTRLIEWARYFVDNSIMSVNDLAAALDRDGNDLLRLNGMGHKSLAYMRVLAGLVDFPVDRHVERLFTSLGCRVSSHVEMSSALFRAAALLALPPRDFERTIWFNAALMPRLRVSPDI